MPHRDERHGRAAPWDHSRKLTSRSSVLENPSMASASEGDGTVPVACRPRGPSVRAETPRPSGAGAWKSCGFERLLHLVQDVFVFSNRSSVVKRSTTRSIEFALELPQVHPPLSAAGLDHFAHGDVRHPIS